MKLVTNVIFKLITAILTLCTLAAQAGELKQAVVYGLDYGGESLKAVKVSTGEKVHTDVNSGLYGSYGFIYDSGDFGVQVTAGLKISALMSSAHYAWMAAPVDMMLLYRFSNFQVGFGLTKHYLPRLENDLQGYTRPGRTSYDNAIGNIAQIGWTSTNGTGGIGLRFTSIKFREKDVINAPEVNGDVVGIYLSMMK